MSARAWAARRGDEAARAERAMALHCRHPGCLRNRRPHYVHFVPSRVPSWALGTNRRGRRKARKHPVRINKNP